MNDVYHCQKYNTFTPSKILKMKSIHTLTFLLTSLSLISFVSCKKEIANESTSTHATSDESSVTVETDGDTTIVTLRPGLKDGQDTYVSKIDADPNDGNTNVNYANDLLASKFYYYGQLATQRGYIKFDSLLKKVPATATIISAKLFLYGKSSSLSFPTGNSYYPGSSNPENPCWVQRVIGKNWQESTITWNTMPGTTTAGQATLPASKSQWNYNAVVDVTTIVKNMLSLQKNFGFCIKMKTESPTRVVIFSTSESSDISLRPKLQIRYQ